MDEGCNQKEDSLPFFAAQMSPRLLTEEGNVRSALGGVQRQPLRFHFLFVASDFVGRQCRSRAPSVLSILPAFFFFFPLTHNSIAEAAITQRKAYDPPYQGRGKNKSEIVRQSLMTSFSVCLR